MAFDILKNTGSQDMTSNCRQAILFVSDGQNNDAINQNPLLFDYVKNERAKYTTANKEPPFIFTYSFGDNANEDAPKQLACDNEGIWSEITDAEDPSEAMGAYYKYFSYGLSDAKNSDFVAWTPPYEFSTGVGLGITVSAPVYNRNTTPPIMSGVVGMDFSFAAMQEAFGSVTKEAREKIIEKIVTRSRARCPVFELDECQREALRQSASDEALCSTCVQVPDIENPICTDGSKKPTLWHNTKTERWSYEERTCCNVGENRPAGLTHKEAIDQRCKEKGTKIKGTTIEALTIGAIIVGVVAFIVVVVAGVCIVRKIRGPRPSKQPVDADPIAFPIALEKAVTPVLPPPTEPK